MLLFFVLLIMVIFMLCGLSIEKAAQSEQKKLRQTMGGIFEYHRRNHVSLIFQNYNLIDYMTPVENVNLTAKQADIVFRLKKGRLKQL